MLLASRAFFFSLYNLSLIHPRDALILARTEARVKETGVNCRQKADGADLEILKRRGRRNAISEEIRRSRLREAAVALRRVHSSEEA